MNRYITIEENDGNIVAFEENESWKDAFEKLDVACWVWQFANTREEAVENHVPKHNEWEDDICNRRTQKDTY
jgi:hypothetical protein